MIICIGREYGSGGHEIGKKLAESLNLSFYDRELVDRAIERSKIVSEALEKADERKANLLLHKVWYESEEKELRGLSANDIIFKLQEDIILQLAREGNCVFVGRCADFILKQAGIPCVSIFISAPFAERVERKKELLQESEKAAASLVRKTDKQRKAYYNYYTGGSWGKSDNYDFCINSSSWGIDQTVRILETVLTQKSV